MHFELTLAAGGRTLTLSAREIERALGPGRPMEFRCAVVGEWVDRAALAELVLAGSPVTATLRADGGTVTAVPQLVAGFREVPHGLVVVTGPAAPPVAPARTIDRPKTATDVLAAVNDVLTVSTAVRNELSAVACPLGDKSCFIQDGGSALDRVAAALARVAALAPAETTRLGVVADTGGNPPFRAVWLDRAAYRKSNTLDAHRLTFADGDGRDDYSFGSRGGRPVVVRHRRDRPFSPATWADWAKRPLPFFTDPGIALEVRDRLFATGGGKVGWDTDIYCEHPETADGSPVPAGWSGAGVVESWQAPWLTVRLTGFVAGRDVAVAKLLTPSSGPDGKGGWHSTPYPGSVVELSWSGRLGEPLLCHGNRRDEVTTVVSPSAVFDREFKIDVPVMKVTAKDRFEAGGREVIVTAEATARIIAETAVEVKGGGGEAQWKNGKFNAGKG